MDTVRLDEGLHRTTAPNGLVVLSESLPGVRSAAVGIYVRTASAHEPPRADGDLPPARAHGVQGHRAAHARSELALELEVRGGSLDAYTGRDHTSYQAHVLDADLPLAVDDPHRPGPPSAAARERPRARAERRSSRRSTASPTRPDDLVFELHAADALARASVRLLHPRHAGDRWRRSRPTTSGCLHRTGYYRGQLRDRGRGQRGPRPAARRCSSGRAGSRAMPGAGPRGRLPPAPAVRGRLQRRGARHRADPHRLRHRHLSAPRSAALRRSRSSPTSSAAGCRAGSSSGCARSWGWPTPSSPTSSFYQSAGQLGRLRRHPAGDAPTRRSRPSARSTTGWPREGLPAAELADGKQQLKGQIMLSLESPMARMGRLAGFSAARRPVPAAGRDAGGDRRGDRGRGRRGGGGVLPARAADRCSTWAHPALVNRERSERGPCAGIDPRSRLPLTR